MIIVTITALLSLIGDLLSIGRPGLNNGISYYVWLDWLPTFILKHLKFNYYATVWADTFSMQRI